MLRSPVLLRWEGRIGHPRQFVARLKGMFEDSGFLTYDPGIMQKSAAIRDAAEYSGSVTAQTEIGKIAWIQFFIGLPLIIILIGIWLVRDALKRPMLLVDVEYEGEEYFASAVDSSESVRSQERVGTISDLRISVRRAIAWPQWRLKKTAPSTEVEQLIAHIERLLNEMLPTLEIHPRPTAHDRSSLPPGQ